MKRISTIALLMLSLSACAVTRPPSMPPTTTEASTTHRELLALPPPEQKVIVSVYRYSDQTGQLKPSDTIHSYSRAVTQGATSILIKALQDAGRGRWFTVLERSQLDHLLKERQIVKEMRQRYGESDRALPAMLFAGLILEGGIISFDSNTKTGGLGARYLGVGANAQYREDSVMVYLRATSTQTGEILKSVMVRKTIASIGLGASAFRFVSFKRLLEAEAGYTSNEPAQEAIKQAIEKAVHTLVLEGERDGMWSFDQS